MGEVKEHTLGWIEFPLAVQSAVAAVLAGIGLELPSWFAQLIVLLVAGAFALVLTRSTWRADSGPARAATGATALGLALVAFGVLSAWGRQLLHPPAGQVSGALAGDAERGWSLRLEDRGQGEMGFASLDWAGQTFVVNFTPTFGKMPYTLVAEAHGCEPVRRRLSLAQADGEAPADMELRCRAPASR